MECRLKIKSENTLEMAPPDLIGIEIRDEVSAVEEATRCLTQVECSGCDLCRYLCPDLCITRNSKTGQIEIDYDFCKGCGICAFICPKGAIRMVREE